MAVVIPVRTRYNNQGFKQLSKAEKEARARAIKMRKLQERHAKAVLQETKQRIAARKRLLAASRRMERQLERERKAAKKAAREAAAEQQRIAAARRAALQAGAGAAAGAAVTIGLMGAVAFESAAKVERLEKASTSMGRRFGVTSAEIVKSIQDVSLGTINQRQALEASNKAMLLGIIRSEDEFAVLTEMAVVMGRAMGVDAAQAIDDMSTGLGRQSRLILDNLGIIVDADRANRIYAETVGKTVSELDDWDRKQAFINETLKIGQRAVSELGEITLDAAGKIERAKTSFSTLTVEVGKLLILLSETDLGEALDPAEALDALAEGATAWQANTEQIGFFTEALSGVNLTLTPTLEEIRSFTQALADAINPIILFGSSTSALFTSLKDGEGFIGSLQAAYEAQISTFGDLISSTVELVTDEEELGQAFTDTQAAIDAEAAALEKSNAAKDAARKAAQEAEAAEAALAEEEKERAERLEKVTEIQRDVARDLIDIDEQATEDLQEAWDDYYSDLADLAKDSGDRIKDLVADSAQAQKDIQADLAADSKKIAKDLAKAQRQLAKDLAKDLAKLEKDSSKNIRRKQQDFVREDRQKTRRKQIDALADERLFQFELRQLEAEGSGNAIAAALERREIEKQIEAEKQANEQATEEENRTVEIERMRTDAAERAAELKAEAEERAAQLKAEAEEKQRLLEEEAEKEEQQRKDELAKALKDEQASFEERRDELGEFVDDKIDAIEDGKKEAIAALAKELQETEDLTKEELGQLVDAAGKLGKEAGEAFAEGLRQGVESVRNIDQLLGGGGGGRGRTPGGRGGPGGTPPRGFRRGGSFTVGGVGGADSQLVQFMATPGEPVVVGGPQQASTSPITINAKGVAPDRLASILELKVQEGIQQYNDEIIVPWAEGM